MGFKGATLEQYDEVMRLMGLSAGGPGPAGAILRGAAKTDDGLRVVDVSETAEAFDTFAAEQIGPFSAQAGFQGPPEIVSCEVHSYFIPA